jgi:hypothetical protein
MKEKKGKARDQQILEIQENRNGGRDVRWS